jgi:hypothetical protein
MVITDSGLIVITVPDDGDRPESPPPAKSRPAGPYGRTGPHAIAIHMQRFCSHHSIMGSTGGYLISRCACHCTRSSLNIANAYGVYHSSSEQGGSIKITGKIEVVAAVRESRNRPSAPPSLEPFLLMDGPAENWLDSL